MRYVPDPNGYFAGQGGYGYIRCVEMNHSNPFHDTARSGVGVMVMIWLFVYVAIACVLKLLAGGTCICSIARFIKTAALVNEGGVSPSEAASMDGILATIDRS